MSSAIDDDLALIRDAAEHFLAEVSDSAAVRAAADSEAGWQEHTWSRTAGELGWCAACVPASLGGLGLDAIADAMLLEQMGRRLFCAPFFSTACLAANVLLEAGSDDARERHLPRIAAGDLRASALPCPDASVLRARRSARGWTLDGCAAQVLDGASAEVLFLPAHLEGSDTLALFAIERGTPGLSAHAIRGWDRTRRFADLELDGVELDAAARIDRGDACAADMRRALARSRLALAAEQLGGAQACLDMSVDYVKTRRQFGRALASFQAIKHRCAEMMVRVETLRSTVYGTAALISSPAGEGTPENECMAAKLLACETYFWCAQETIQLHGGIGFTWEHDAHLHLKRAQAGHAWLGAPQQLRTALADALIDREVA
ncbi:MAG: acyl-CoA dehydrogenase family protein [Rudaea sp.]|uniref:acyl-CoA dehydrogenase family protein n=1 Tax=Rudaea sp. TaxID=2136325 RepID=UPI0039E66188